MCVPHTASCGLEVFIYSFAALIQGNEAKLEQDEALKKYVYLGLNVWPIQLTTPLIARAGNANLTSALLVLLAHILLQHLT